MVRVKICGITSWADAKLCVDAGADALGFNFFPPSPRCVSPAEAWDIIRRLPPYIEAWGVFVDWKPSVMLALARAIHLTGVQLHGNEPAGDVGMLAKHVPVVKAFAVKEGFKPESLRRYRAASAILLEGFRRGFHGGAGAKMDWQVARGAGRVARIVLAGGLTPENVAEAIHTAQPFAVDVATGLEVKIAKKDPLRVRAFMHTVEEVNRESAASN
ncbi:MAG: phosphoribosylanthranilate isomerase [Candidatus Acidiferrales bacterium]